MTTDVNDTHYEAVLDDEPDWGRAPVYVDVVSKPETDRRPVLPAKLHRGNFGKTVQQYAGLQWHRACYHGLRTPWYLLLAALWSVVAVFKLAGKQIHWFWVVQAGPLQQEAATTNEPVVWQKLHVHVRDVRLFRAIILGLEGVAILIAGILIYAYGDLLIWVVAGLVVIPTLAHYGHPATVPIVQAAVVPPRFRVINSDIVLRAYYAAKLGKPGTSETEVRFGSRMERDGDGGRVTVELPHGYTFADAVKAKPQIASGLDVTENQVFLQRDKTSIRRHELYVTDVDPLSIPAGPSPLLAGKQTDIWRPAPFGLDERGNKVTVPLMWNSILVGAQPRKGKTFSARLLALYAALDPYVQLILVDGKNSPDWKDFRMIAHRYISGTHPNALSSDPINELLATLNEVKAHIQEVNSILAGLPVNVCPEGKITRELSRTHPKLRAWLVVMEEFQVYYETDDQAVNKEIAGLLSFIISVGPSAGVSILSSSQKPSGIGAGDVGRLFNRYRDNHAGRFALKCGNRIVSDAILGGDAYSEGFDAASLPNGPEYRGVGYLYGLADHTPIVRTHLATGQDAERILQLARGHRERLGTLTGFAAGEAMSAEFRDVMQDVRDVFRAGEVWISWPQLATRLRELSPSQYAEITAATISQQVRDLGASPKKGRDTFQDDSPSVWGVPRDDVDKVLHRREIEAVR